MLNGFPPARFLTFKRHDNEYDYGERTNNPIWNGNIGGAEGNAKIPAIQIFL